MVWRNVSNWKTIAKEAFTRTTLVAKFLCYLHLTETYLGSTVLVFGPSMFPTLNLNGDVILAERVSTRFGMVGPGDVVLISSPENPRKNITKRIWGMEGDRLSVPIDPYDSEKCRSVQVPKGHIWVQGDNPYASRDSRHFGPVPYGLVQAKVVWRIWPPDGFGSLRQGVWQ